LHPAAQFCFDRMQLCQHPVRDRLTPDDEGPLLLRFPQQCVKPGNVKVSGFPSLRFFRF
jgi:hypothetical protein